MHIARDVARALVAAGLLADETIVRGGVSFETTQGRNCNFRITVTGGDGLFVKQARDASQSLANEAMILGRLGTTPLRRVVPALRHFDGRKQLLALELMRDVRPIRSAFGDRPLWADLGRSLARVHNTAALTHDVRATAPPWILSLSAPPLEMLREMSSANVQLLRIVQEARWLCESLDTLRDSWRLSSLIHFDIRFANCLVEATHRRRRLRIVDWELSGLGDPDWDVGCVFSSLLMHWLFTMDFDGKQPIERVVSRADKHLSTARGALRDFWRTYTNGRATNAGNVMRATAFAAARLIQLAYERQRWSAEITRNVVALAQLSENIARSPHRAATELLGVAIP